MFFFLFIVISFIQIILKLINNHDFSQNVITFSTFKVIDFFFYLFAHNYIITIFNVYICVYLVNKPSLYIIVHYPLYMSSATFHDPIRIKLSHTEKCVLPKNIVLGNILYIYLWKVFISDTSAMYIELLCSGFKDLILVLF